MENVSNIITGLNIPDQIPLDVKAYCASESVLSSLGLYNNLAFVYYEGLVVRCQLEKTRWEWREVKPGERGLLSNDFQYPDNWIVYGFDYSLKYFNFFKVDYSSLDKDFSKIVYFNATEPINATIFDLANPPITNDDSLKEDDNNLYIGTDASSWIYDQAQNLYETYISSSNKSNFFITGTNNDAGGIKTGSITKKGEFVIDSETPDVSGLVLKQLVADSLSILKVDAFGNVVKVSKVKDIDYEPLIPDGLPAQYYGGGKVWKDFPTSFPPSPHGHLATDIVETTNKLFQTSLQNQYNDATSSIQTQLDNLRNSIPDVYAQVVYVNSTSPNTATVFDIVNPPITNNNTLKNNVLNLYVGSDASTWVYKTSPAGYVTKTITAVTSNFNLAGTSTDAGNNKISDIERTGKIIAGGFKVNGAVGLLKSDGTVDLTNYERISNKNQANGYVGLGSDSKILASQLPPSKIKNGANVDQFTYLLDQGFQITGAGDTSVSFDATNKRITISSTPGAGGGGAVVSFNGRTGAVVTTEGDYSLNLLGDVTIASLLDKSIIQYNSGTTQWENKVLNTSIVPEFTNLYYTNARAIGAPLTGYVSSPGTVLPTDSILQAFNKVNGNIGLKADISQLHNPVTIDIANGLSLVNQVLSLGLASSGVTGALSGTDWNTFNNKANANGSNASGTWNITSSFTNILNPQIYTDANQQTVPGFRAFLTSTGAVNVPFPAGAGIEIKRAENSLSSVGSFQLWSTNNQNENGLYFRKVTAFTTSEVWTPFAKLWDSENLVNPVTGTGATGQISFWSGAGTQVGDSGLFWNNTTKRLQLLTSDSRFEGGDNNGRLIVANATTTAYLGLNGSTHPTSPNNINLVSTTGKISLLTNNAENFTVLNNGNIGINQLAPTERLDVVGNIRASSTLISGNQLSSQTGVNQNISGKFFSTYSTTNGTQYNLLGVYGTTDSATDVFTHTTGELSKNFYLGLVSNLAFFNNGVAGSTRFSIINKGIERFSLDSFNGNVGIGITTPAEKLDVVGSIKTNGILKVLGVGGVNSGTGTVHLNNGIDAKTWALTSGIPATYQEGFSIRNVTDNTTLFYILNNGNTAIGGLPRVPAEKLDVVGNIKASGIVYSPTVATQFVTSNSSSGILKLIGGGVNYGGSIDVISPSFGSNGGGINFRTGLVVGESPVVASFNSSGKLNVVNTITASPATVDAELATLGQVKAVLNNATLTGTPTAPTATAGTNTTQLATTAFVTEAVTTADAGNVKLTGSQTIAGVKTMLNSVSETRLQLTNSATSTREVLSVINPSGSVANGSEFYNNSNSLSKGAIYVNSSGSGVGLLSEISSGSSNTNAIKVDVSSVSSINDAVVFNASTGSNLTNHLALKVNNVNVLTISKNGDITANKLIIPNAVNANEAVNKGQLDAVAIGGSYTPTTTNVANVANFQSNLGSRYVKVGNVVTVTINIPITATANNTLTQASFTLPPGLNNVVTSAGFLLGIAKSIGNGVTIHGIVRSLSATAVRLDYTSLNTSTHDFHISFSYQTN